MESATTHNNTAPAEVVSMNFMVPSEMKRRLEVEAKKVDRSLSSYLRLVIGNHINHLDFEVK